MSYHFFTSIKKQASTSVAIAMIASLSLSPLAAQTTARPSSDVPVSRVDIYGGYGYLHPVSSGIGPFQYDPINPGAVTSISGYFTPVFGIQAEGSFFPNGPDDCIYTAQAGPIARMQRGRFVPFAHALFGGAKVGGPAFQPCTWGWGVTAGLGFDYILPGLGNHVALRPIQADYEFSQVEYGPLVLPAQVSGGQGNIEAYRLSAGVVLRFGDMEPPVPVALTCSVQPGSGYPGDPETITANATNLNAKKPVTYSWTSSAGGIQGTTSTASINTKGLQPGTYTVTGHVSQGDKVYQSASCNTTFTVLEFAPPTITCSANPDTVAVGTPSTITSHAISPQNRPMTYSYSATSGSISGSDTVSTLVTTGATPGVVTVTCNAVDDLGKTASATTAVNVMAVVAAPPPVPSTEPLCSVSFERDRKRPVRVDNEAKGCLDDIALALQQKRDATLVIVGNHASGETDAMAAERAANVEKYLTDEKGIDSNRIEIWTGAAGTRSVQNTLVPLGATYSPESGHKADLKAVVHHGQSYGKPKKKP